MANGISLRASPFCSAPGPRSSRIPESLVEEVRGPVGEPPDSFHEWLCALSPAASERLFDRLGQFGLVFLDRAWAGAAESVMQTGLSLDRQQGVPIVVREKALEGMLGSLAHIASKPRRQEVDPYGE
jgi:hypothetical protein